MVQQDQISSSKKPNRKIWLILISAVVVLLCLCGGVVSVLRISSDLREKQYVGKPTLVPDQTYVNRRTMALGKTPDELGLDVDPNSNIPYGIVMDWNIGQATSTLASFATGDADMYYSTGGGWLGGIRVEGVRNASLQFVTSAGSFVDKLDIVTSYPMPPVGYVRFYIITPQGVYGSGDVDSKTLTLNDVDFSSLFSDANSVIFEMQLVTPK